MSDNNNILIGAFYELPDGRITRTYGISQNPEVVLHYFDVKPDAHESTPAAEVLTSWTPRRDISDFPNARDPRVHFDFDLFWDIKHISELKHVISNNFQDPWSGNEIHNKDFFISLIHKHGLTQLLSS